MQTFSPVARPDPHRRHRIAVLPRALISTAGILLVAAVTLVPIDAQRAALAAIHAYQHSLSPLAGRIGIQCRFTPTCSRYAEQVIQRDGVWQGGWRALKRIARCTPLTSPGTRDEPYR